MNNNRGIEIQRKIIFNSDYSASATYKLDSRFSVQIFYLKRQTETVLGYEHLWFVRK